MAPQPPRTQDVNTIQRKPVPLATQASQDNNANHWDHVYPKPVANKHTIVEISPDSYDISRRFPDGALTDLRQHENSTVNHSQRKPELRPSVFATTFSALRWWYLEILSIIVAVACVCALVVVLSIFDGKPQDSWLGGDLTINGLVAILATICRTCLMFAVAAGIAQGKWYQLRRSDKVDDGSYQLGSFALFEEASKGPWGSTLLLFKYKGL